MSYCRWSSDDWSCDVYVYEDVHGGWTTHVAGRRHVFTGPLPAPVALPTAFTNKQFDAWCDRQRVVSEMLEDATMADIGLSNDGLTFNDPTPLECAERLQALAAEGYHVPPDVIEDLLAESVSS